MPCDTFYPTPKILALNVLVAQIGGGNDEVLDASVAAECGEFAVWMAERGAEATRTESLNVSAIQPASLLCETVSAATLPASDQ